MDGAALHAEIVAVVPYDDATLRPPLGRFGAQHAWIPYMRNATLTAVDTAETTCTGRIDLPWPLRERRWTVRMRSETREADRNDVYVSSWRYVPGSGDLVDSQGSWSLEDLGDRGPLVRLEATADLGDPVAGAMLSWAERRALPRVLRSLLRQADVAGR